MLTRSTSSNMHWTQGETQEAISTNQAESLEETAFIVEIPKKLFRDQTRKNGTTIAHELKSLLSHDTWQIVSRPENEKIIGSRIVLQNKYNQDGNLERRKARIVVKGFAQRPGIDFDEIYANSANRIYTIDDGSRSRK